MLLQLQDIDTVYYTVYNARQKCMCSARTSTLIGHACVSSYCISVFHYGNATASDRVTTSLLRTLKKLKVKLYSRTPIYRILINRNPDLPEE